MITKMRFRKCHNTETHKTTSLPCDKCPYMQGCFNDDNKYNPLSEEFKLDIHHDVFYDIDGKLTMVYYNPDAMSGGQFVECVFTNESIINAKNESSGNIDDFFNYLESSSRTYLYDINKECFRDFVDEYSEYSEDELMFTRDKNEKEIYDWLVDYAEVMQRFESEHPPITI